MPFQTGKNLYLASFILNFSKNLYSVVLKLSRLVTDIPKISPSCLFEVQKWGRSGGRNGIQTQHGGIVSLFGFDV